ncbi:CAP domain-containing protein [Syncephalastrum racemosum]|uniref:CAP domain-containing protein n=1 Tax=Syncephalastrum racemosum TaxID=13706 RepID=A0A1X2HQP8_SYNRA|nr:CAP domain-containing protein [Syncephalastrum racemosum]
MRSLTFLSFVLALFASVVSAISAKSAKNVLKVHNKYRAKHSAPALKWNSTLEHYAQHWSNACDFKHSQGPYGENLAMGYSNWNDAIAAWYNEGEQYSYNNPGFSSSTGHFTQVVWKSTTQIGCGVKKCPDGSKMYTCSYSPPGNVVTADNSFFKKNVLPN